jgi:hypothetical protein
MFYHEGKNVQGHYENYKNRTDYVYNKYVCVLHIAINSQMWYEAI